MAEELTNGEEKHLVELMERLDKEQATMIVTGLMARYEITEDDILRMKFQTWISIIFH